MRVLVPAFLLILLSAAPTVSAHGGAEVEIRLTDEGCTGESPCLQVVTGSLERDEDVTVYVQNSLGSDQEWMVHADADGRPGAVVAGVEPLPAGSISHLEVFVRPDLTGIWVMTIQDGSESARLFVAAEGHDSEDSPGVGLPATLSVLAVGAALVLRRRA